MADNVELNAGSGGSTLATDDISGVHYQRVKMAYGTDGNAADVSSSNPMPIAGAVTNAGTFAVQAAQSGAWTVNLGATDNAVLDAIAALLSSLDSGQLADGHNVTVDNASLTVDGSGVTQPVSGTVTANLSATDNAVLDVIEANTSPGANHYRNIDANTESEMKSSAGTLHWLHAMNLTGAKAYLHLYDAAAASVTPGSTTPTFTFALPTQGNTNGAGFALQLNHDFANGITLVCTTTLDGSAGDPGTNGVIVNAGYT